MRTRTLAAMLLDIRQRTNQENSEFVTDDELTEYLNQEIAELWSRLVMAQGQPHYRALHTIAVAAPQSLYPLPADFWQLQGVEATVNSQSVPLRPFMPHERAGLTNPLGWGPCSPVRYRIQAGNIEFLPATLTFEARVFYTPAAPRLVDDSDTFDGFNGYEMAPIYGVCATVLQKEESDPSFYAGQKDRLYRQIDALAAQRDAANPERVQDVMGGYIEDDERYWWGP